MNSVLVALVALGSFYMAYKVYGSFLSRKVFVVEPDRLPPSHEFRDDRDYVPTVRKVLWGHHFTSIAGAAPIVGPAIGVIWGWVPAFLWVVLGSIFMGGVHDFGALLISVRNRGETIGELTGGLIGRRARMLFMLIILFLLWIVIAVFALIIASLFKNYPATVIPIWAEMVIAVLVGIAIYRLKWKVGLLGFIALVVMYITIWIGAKNPVDLNLLGIGKDYVLVTWIWIVCIYALVASILPVWTLLQPRDFINAEELIVALIVLYGGLFVAHRPIVAPAFRFAVPGAHSIVPFLFITIACGAISGFHSLVSSGTSAKQINHENDIRFVGYGAMLAEGALAVVAILACTAGFASDVAWHEHYATWSKAGDGLGPKLAAFLTGGQVFVTELGLPKDVAIAFLGVVIVSFAMTTIDTATRLQRYVIAELGRTTKWTGFLKNRFVASAIAAGSALLLALQKGPGPMGPRTGARGTGGMTLWPVFGATNQLLAALALLVVTVWLYKHRKPIIYTLLPMIAMLIITTIALSIQIIDFTKTTAKQPEPNWLLASVGCALLAMTVWLVVEALIMWRRMADQRREGAIVGAGPGAIAPAPAAAHDEEVDENAPTEDISASDFKDE